MKNLILRSFIKLSAIRRDKRGQDLIEYALMTGFIAVAAAALLPNVSASISTIFSKMANQLSALATSASS